MTSNVEQCYYVIQNVKQRKMVQYIFQRKTLLEHNDYNN